MASTLGSISYFLIPGSGLVRAHGAFPWDSETCPWQILPEE